MDQTNSTNEEKPAQTVQRFSNISPNVEPVPDGEPGAKPAPADGKPEEEEPAKPRTLEGSDKDYYNTTHDYLERERKERNAIIMRIDKIEDERIDKGTDDYDDAAREINRLQGELWRKNNLIEALTKVLISLSR